MQKVFVGTYSIINGGYGDDTPQTLDAQLAEIKRLGYDGVEFLANDLENHTPEEIRELLDKYGLEAYSSHMTVEAMEGLFEKGQALGLKYFFSARENIITAEDAVYVASRLNELAKILTADNAELYEKLVKDLGETGTKFQDWWNRMAEKYQWESAEDGNWEINFDTCEIYLVTP